MADPARKDDSLSGMRFPESPSSGDLSQSPLMAKTQPIALLPEDTPSRPLGEWPSSDIAGASVPKDSRLQNAGEVVGSALGTVVSEANKLPGRLQDRMSDLKKRFRVIVGSSSAEFKERAAGFTKEAEHKSYELAGQAGREIRELDSRARVYARRYPLQFIAGAAAVGFSIGFLLRLWGDE